MTLSDETTEICYCAVEVLDAVDLMDLYLPRRRCREPGENVLKIACGGGP